MLLIFHKNIAVDTDQMSTENQDTILTKGPVTPPLISKVTLPASLKYEDEETIIDSTDTEDTIIDSSDSSEEIELEEDIVVQEDDSPKKDLKSSPHYEKLIKNVRDEGMEAIVGSFLKLVCSIVLFHGIRKVNP